MIYTLRGSWVVFPVRGFGERDELVILGKVHAYAPLLLHVAM